MKKSFIPLMAIALSFFYTVPSQAEACVQQSVESQAKAIQSARQLNPTTIEIWYTNNQHSTLDFYGENIFRIFQDNAGGIIRDPKATPEAQILVDNPRLPLSKLTMDENENRILISTTRIEIEIDKQTSLMKVTNLENGKVAFEETSSALFGKNKVTLILKEDADEYFYGGGVQNGRFSHKGKAIAIVNENSWTDGGVASPTPFYWSTKGYGMMWHTFKKGKYDFGAEEAGKVKLAHETDYLDVFFMISETPSALLNDFYQLTGHPVLLPKFGFYEGHLNAYNRDYWKEDPKGILFEDGKRYKESQKDNGGIKESLNGEKNNYQFSARAVIDRYKQHDMPLGWLLPNDGYGAGYGQTETLDGNIQNLKELGDYARKSGVEIGLWTQSDLHPKEGISALLQRDIVKEVRDAGVRVLKTDVAWVGAGYSFGLNGVADVGEIMPYYGNNARPFIISLDGWAGTQRYAGIWSGDQTGGEWEYIRFHIPTYICSGLSGQPNISSDMDGIFGGQHMQVNIRDFQWKTWSPMQLNMDGWGRNEKYPHALGEPATSINRMYLKLKAELMPYTYSFAKEAVDGLPMIRAMFLEYPNEYTLGKATQYQYLFGTDFLVAPIYQDTQADAEGNDIRDGIYLPEGEEWIDYFSGEKYEGGCILNNFATPLWKLPVFIKNGAIIPMTHPHNNVYEINKGVRIYEIYPKGHSAITEYDDDGATEAYRNGEGTTTLIESDVNDKGNVLITIHPTKGDFNGFVKEKATEFRINVTEQPKKLSAQVGKKKVKLQKANSLEEFKQGENMYFYDEAPNLNRFATPGSDFEKVIIQKNPQVLIKLASCDVTSETIKVAFSGFVFEPADNHRVTSGTLVAPKAQITDENTEAYTLKPTWEKVANADYYEIELNGMIYTTIKNTELLFDGLKPETPYSFKIRSVNKDGYSDWASFEATTKTNPLEFAIRGIQATCTSAEQWGMGPERLFDFAEAGDMWHTKYGAKAMPCDLIIDLNSYNQVEKFHYLPRLDSGNGTLLKGKVFYSEDKKNWAEAGDFDWKRSSDIKVFEFNDKPTMRYIKLSISEAVGNYGSGREIYIFKVPGTESYIPGDINIDGKIDANDLMSYTNYTGLRKGDGDFDGYISNGDINRNGLIDAYDISVVGTQLEEGVEANGKEQVSGTIEIKADKRTYDEGETARIMVKGIELKDVNALSFALPYDAQQWEFQGIEAIGLKQMENLTYDRLHTNGTKALYPTFVNLGEKETLEGSNELFIIKLKAKQKGAFNLKMTDGILVDKLLNEQTF